MNDQSVGKIGEVISRFRSIALDSGLSPKRRAGVARIFCERLGAGPETGLQLLRLWSLVTSFVHGLE